MAIVKYGGGVIQLSGAIAGNVFARNSTSNYVRALTKPVNPNTARQVAVRAALSELTARWSQTLTQAQRDAWDLYGSNVTVKNRLGDDINISGFNHYLRSNVIIAMQSIGYYDDGPTVFELPAADPTYAVTASEATQQITFVYDDTMAWATETGGYLWCFQGIPQNAQRNFFDGPWRHFGGIAGIDAAPPPSPGVLNVAFAVAEAQRMWCYARIQRVDGRISEPFRSDVLVAA